MVIHDEPDNFSPATKNSAGNPLACGKLQNREGLEDNIEGSENQEDASEGSGEEKKSLGPLAVSLSEYLTIISTSKSTMPFSIAFVAAV